LYCWIYDIGSAVHGGSKATRDTCYFLSEAGWELLDTTCRGSNILRAIQLARHLISIFRMPSKSIIFVQFPAYGIASKFLLRIIVRRFKSIVLIHDLDRLRGRPDDSPEKTLKHASFIIYTGRLQARLVNLDIPSTTLEVWDYRLESTQKNPAWDPSGPILFAGILAKKKNSWLYQKCAARPRLLLYGNQYERDANPNGDDYRGEFAPDTPFFEGPISWGLVWDGNSTSRRSESNQYESYDRFNQPHKLSLYLACCLPVIAWRKAAISDFVQKHQCGILIDDLEDIGIQLKKYSQADLLSFRENAIRLSANVRSGHFIKQAANQFALHRVQA
jgi:hypothetical protein